MEIIRCPKGHFYDADKSATCPTCANENGNQEFSFGDASVGQTATTYPGTEPISGGFNAGGTLNGMCYDGFVGKSSDTMETEAFISGKSVNTVPKTVPVNDDNGKANANKKVQNYPPTIPVTPGPDSNVETGHENGAVTHGVFNPVTGWLVCVKGPSKGTDYRVRSQYNYVGRAKHMDICISGDEYISAEKAAIIAYDEMEKKFFIAPGMGHNLIRLNDKMVMGSELLHPYDKITIGKTTLLFVPLCGDQFDWAEC